MFLRIMLIVSVGMAFVEESDNPSVLMPVEPYDTSLLQFSLTGATNEPLWKNLRDAEIVASSSLNQFSLPENLKGIHHNIWVAAGELLQWLTFSFAQAQTIDGIRVWNVQKNSAFKEYIFKMSPNDGYDWYDIKAGTGINQVCCEYQEILFPAAHAKMFKLLMNNNHHGTENEKTSLSYIEFRFLPEPAYLCPYYAVPYDNFCYAVVDRTLYGGVVDADLFCQDTLLALPLGWNLATYSDGVRDNVVMSPWAEQKNHWGTTYVVFADEAGYDTKTGVRWKLPDSQGVHHSVNGVVHSSGKYKPKWCKSDGSGTRVDDITDDTGTVPLDVDGQCLATSGKCVSRLLMQMAQNSTRRFTPPFVGRKDANNNLVFGQTI